MSCCGMAQPCLRGRTTREDAELKELRRREAAAAATKMEFRSLEGLDLFGVSHGCTLKGQSSAKGSLLGGGLHRKSFV